MSWPISLLNASNRRLEEEVRELSANLRAQREACAEVKESAAFSKEALQLAQKQRNELEKELLVRRETLETNSSELKTIQNECEGAQRAAKSFKDTCAHLELVIKEQDAAIHHHHQLLDDKMNESKLLEEEAKAVALSYLAKRKQGEALEGEIKELSFSVWAKLERLHKEIARKEASLRNAKEENANVLRELDNAQHTFFSASQSQRQLIQVLELVRNQQDALDKQVSLNGETMSTLKERESTKLAERQKLIEGFNHLQKNHQKLRETHEVKHAGLSKAIVSLRALARSLHEGEKTLKNLQHQYRIESDEKKRLWGEITHHQRILEERQKVLGERKEQLTRTRELSKAVEREKSSGMPSLTALLSIQRLQEQTSARLDDRLLRVRERLSTIMQEFRKEAERSDRTHEEIRTMQKYISECAKEEDALQKRRDLATKALKDFDAQIQKIEEGIRATRDAADAQRETREEELKSIILHERQTLQREMQNYRALLRDLTSLRGLVRGGALAGRKAELAELAEGCNLIEKELPGLTQVLLSLEEEEKLVNWRESRAEITLHALRAAAKDQGSTLKAAVGVEAHLRARFELSEGEIDETARSLLLELHLLQNAAREEGEEFRRKLRQRDLLRSRYEEVMANMARLVQKPFTGQEAMPSHPKNRLSVEEKLGTMNLALPELGFEAPPEALHARMLLQRSYEREYLLQQGNYLDRRVVNLERETESLRRLLELTKTEMQGSGNRRGRPQNDGEELEIPADTPAPPSSKRKDGEGGQKGYSLRNSASKMGLDELQDAMNARGEMLRVEIQRQEALINSMKEQHSSLRIRGKELKKALADVEIEKRQKRTQLQRLEDEFRRKYQQKRRGGYS